VPWSLPVVWAEIVIEPWAALISAWSFWIASGSSELIPPVPTPAALPRNSLARLSAEMLDRMALSARRIAARCRPSE